MNKIKTIGITGPRGFIGSYLLNKLDYARFHIKKIDSDVMDYDSLLEELKGVDVVIHTAVKKNDSFDVNSTGTLNVIKACLKNKCKLIHFATSTNYKTVLTSDFKSQYPVPEDFNDYDLSKGLADNFVEFFVKNYGLQAVIIKLCTIYDENGKDAKGNDANIWKGRSYPRFKLLKLITQIIENHDFTKFKKFKSDSLIQKYRRIKFKLRTSLK